VLTEDFEERQNRLVEMCIEQKAIINDVITKGKDLNNRQVQFAADLTAVLLLCPRSELSQLQRVMAAPLPADMPLTASALVAHGSPITSAFFLLQTLVFTT
jgi:hypothetical protein